jgi:CheY-like chemotaxis protein
LSKLEHGKLVLQSTPFDLNEVLHQVGDLVSDSCARKGLQYSAEIAPDVKSKRLGDAQRLTQALLNLVSNAVKFTEHGQIQVSVSRCAGDNSGERLRFEVQDSGAGLSPELQSRVFEGFVQGDNEQTRLHGGTGLGLSICKSLAQMMNGDVGVQSQEGVGSTFWFTVQLPLAPVGMSLPSDDVPAAAIPRLALAIHVLLVEDNVSMRDVLQQLLELAGARVDTAENGEVAVQRVKATRYDLVLMDMQMPVLGGLEATQIIRQDPVQQDLPIVALTAGGFNEDRDRFFAAGVNDYLTKPFEYKDLIAALERNLPNRGVICSTDASHLPAP